MDVKRKVRNVIQTVQNINPFVTQRNFYLILITINCPFPSEKRTKHGVNDMNELKSRDPVPDFPFGSSDCLRVVFVDLPTSDPYLPPLRWYSRL